MRNPGILRAFKKNRDGATAVEFALVAGPFFFFLLALIEIAAVFFAETVIENAVLESARLIRTGQLQGGGGDANAFRDEVCTRIEVIANCDNMVFEVAVFEDFDGINPTPPTNAEGELDGGSMGFDPGQAGDIVMVRVYYAYPLILPNMFGSVADLPDNQRLIMSATVFRNEPFDD